METKPFLRLLMHTPHQNLEAPFLYIYSKTVPHLFHDSVHLLAHCSQSLPVWEALIKRWECSSLSLLPRLTLWGSGFGKCLWSRIRCELLRQIESSPQPSQATRSSLSADGTTKVWGKSDGNDIGAQTVGHVILSAELQLL